MKKIKLGIIGTGEIAHHHIKVIKSFRDCEVTSVFNRTKSKAKVFAKKYSKDDIAVADQILASNTDKIINAANTETFDYGVYEQVVQCYRKLGGFLLKNSETILQNKEEIDGIILQRIELLKRVLSAG